jgi:hypothetical protein
MRYPGQSFGSNDDWPRAPITAYTATIDYGSKSSKEDFMVESPKRSAEVLPSLTASTLSAAITPGTSIRRASGVGGALLRLRSYFLKRILANS